MTDHDIDSSPSFYLQQGKLVEEADLLTRERLCIGLTTFEVMLERIRSFLLEDPTWNHNSSSTMSQNMSPLSNIDDTHDFHRIWSALQFVYCLPTRNENDMNVEQLYGEGLNFAGCTIIRLLNEHRKFETYDFAYHLFKINRSDQKEDEVKHVVGAKKFIDFNLMQLLSSVLLVSADIY